jgi:hypothetical protein
MATSLAVDYYLPNLDKEINNPALSRPLQVRSLQVPYHVWRNWTWGLLVLVLVRGTLDARGRSAGATW